MVGSVSLKYSSLLSFLLALGVSVFPIYLFPSGGVQVSHVVFALFSCFSLVRFGVFFKKWIFWFLVFVFYVFFIEVVYVVLGANVISLLNSLYFLFNFLVVVSVYAFCINRGMDGLIAGVSISFFIEILSVVFVGVSLHDVSMGRSVGTFNNPNQLGYFSVCLFSMSYLLYLQRRVPYVYFLALVIASIFLSIASLSKAAMISVFLVSCFALKPAVRDSGLIDRIYSFLFWFFLLAFIVVVFFWPYLKGDLYGLAFVKRILGVSSEADSSLSSRGYFAFLNGSYIQLFFGLGEAYVQEIVGHEVHSTLGSVFNKYGIFGFLMFLSIFVSWFFRLCRAYGFWVASCLAGPSLLYGVTHNGTRFTLFWVLFGVSMAVADRVIRQRSIKALDKPLKSTIIQSSSTE